MAILAAAVILIGILCVLDLLLTVGVIRRLREHTQLIASGGGLGMSTPQPRPGAEIAEFTATDTDGGTLHRDQLAADTLVGFFSPDCGPCTELLPQFVEHAASLREGSGTVIAVVATPSSAEPEMVAQLSRVARVIVEPQRGPAAEAFGISGFPTLLRVGHGGTVAAVGGNLDAVRSMVAGAR